MTRWSVSEELELRSIIRQLKVLGKSFSPANIRPYLPNRNNDEIYLKLYRAQVLSEDTADDVCFKLARQELRDVRASQVELKLSYAEERMRELELLYYLTDLTDQDTQEFL